MKMQLVAKAALIFFCVNTGLAQVSFKSIDRDETGKLVLPQGMKYDLLFREGDTIYNVNGKTGPAKGNHDLNIYIPLENSRRGKIYTSHEENAVSDLAGDGGGGTVYEIEWSGNSWKSGKKTAIDFSKVGGTYNNCSGTLTTKGTILSTEEAPPVSNSTLMKSPYAKDGIGFRDTSDFNGMKRYENMGWVVEVDPVSKKAIHKLYKMGRFSHEGIWIMPDKKTVYLADDNYPAVFFKFVAKSENDFTDGQLYAFKQTKAGKGSWITLPMEIDSLVNIREVALRKGATVFVRMEWITMVNGKMYITETGLDDFNADTKINFKGDLAYYIKEKCSKGNDKYDYPFGALIEFDPASDILRPVLFGGAGTEDTLKHFSNPDGITYRTVNGKSYLIMNEDLLALTKGRVTEKSLTEKKLINEVWWLDLSLKKPTIDNLQRFMVIPAGAESTGGYFTPDGMTYFVNIQHPLGSNEVPFNKSCTIAVTGFLPEGKKTKKK
jgi:hypothetical protein